MSAVVLLLAAQLAGITGMGAAAGYPSPPASPPGDVVEGPAGTRAAAELRTAVDTDTIPEITLREALRRATDLDPNYVASLRQIGDAAWLRRSAFTAFVLPSVNFQTSFTRFSTEIFNIGTNSLTTELVQASVSASYDVFRGGQKWFELGRTDALVDGAEAGELQARFQTALGTEADYYDVIAQRELARVASERVRRAEEQLEVARARVVSGAAVQSDSLQLLLERTRAQVDLLQQESALTIARLQLGRRVGVQGPVDATPVDTLPAPALPLTREEAVEEAIRRGPRAVVARADERAAEASLRQTKGSYLPTLSLFGNWNGFDDAFFPTATTRTAFGFQVSLPIWNGAQRELSLYRAGTAAEVARTARRDEELSVGRDMAQAYQTYETARASTELAIRAVQVARENLRVQQERYRVGATTIIDLVTAQVDLAEAEAGLVQARFATRLALAGVEAILGRRLFGGP